MSKVERHVIGTSADPAGMAFDRAASTLEPGKLSDVEQVGNAYVIAKVAEKWPGEPVAFEQAKNMLKRELQGRNEQKARTDLIKEAEKRGLLKWLPAGESLRKRLETKPE